MHSHTTIAAYADAGIGLKKAASVDKGVPSYRNIEAVEAAITHNRGALGMFYHNTGELENARPHFIRKKIRSANPIDKHVFHQLFKRFFHKEK